MNTLLQHVEEIEIVYGDYKPYIDRRKLVENVEHEVKKALEANGIRQMQIRRTATGLFVSSDAVEVIVRPLLSHMRVKVIGDNPDIVKTLAKEIVSYLWVAIKLSLSDRYVKDFNKWCNRIRAVKCHFTSDYWAGFDGKYIFIRPFNRDVGYYDKDTKTIALNVEVVVNGIEEHLVRSNVEEI